MRYLATRRAVATGNRVLSAVGLATGVTASLGHVSSRVPEDPDRFVVKGRGLPLDALAAVGADDMVCCDLDGRLVEGPPGVTQCFEVQIHAAVYRARPEVSAVLHVHPRHVVLMSVLGTGLVPMCQEGANLVRRPVPTWPHTRLVTTAEDGDGVAALLAESPVAVLHGHGAVGRGQSIAEVVTTMLALEEQARMNYLATCALGADHPRIDEALLVEADEAPPLSSLPHFADGPGLDPTLRQANIAGGAYGYFASLVGDPGGESEDLAQRLGDGPGAG